MPPRSRKLENDKIAKFFPEYIDVWPALHPSLAGCTFDTSTNVMLQANQHTPEVMRYDRVLSTRSATCEPVAIELIGTEPITLARRPDVRYVVPSDHFGLVATFEIRQP
jgi:hypothetical protein